MELWRPKLPVLFLALFAFLGFLDAAYLTADHYFGLPVPCTLTEGCDTVLNSEYATLGPFPVALFGLIYYLAVLLLSVFVLTSDAPAKKAADLILLLASAAFLFSLYLLYLQFFVIEALCIYCLFSAGLSALILICAYLVRLRARAA